MYEARIKSKFPIFSNKSRLNAKLKKFWVKVEDFFIFLYNFPWHEDTNGIDTLIWVKPETYYPDAMWHDTTLRDEIRSGTAILNEHYRTFLVWYSVMQCDKSQRDEDLGVPDFYRVISCRIALSRVK